MGGDMTQRDTGITLGKYNEGSLRVSYDTLDDTIVLRCDNDDGLWVFDCEGDKGFALARAILNAAWALRGSHGR